ncbi:MAG: aldolase [Methanothrix sp.]
MPVDGHSPWQEISRLGKKLIQTGLTSSRFGNISLLNGDKIFITCTGSMLDELDEDGVVNVDLRGSCPEDAIASSEICVHRAVYQCTSHQAIVHTHSPYAVAASLLETTEVLPLDSEGRIFLGPMPIVAGGMGSNALAIAVSSALQDHKACIARGHGVFAPGSSLKEAYEAAAMAEHSAQIGYLVKSYCCEALRTEKE